MIAYKTNLCIIFAKWPEEGKVKSRLAIGSSCHFAKEFYTLCCETVVQELSSQTQWQCIVAYSPLGAEDRFKKWLQRCGPVALNPQKNDPDLGVRMACSIQQAFQSGIKKVVLVGSDIPDLNPDIVKQAFHLLDNVQVVLGPAVDGGFYLIGAIEMPENLLQGIEWSTSTVLETTSKQCVQLGLTVDIDSLPCLSDIDTIQDLREWLESSNGHPLHEPIQQLLCQDKQS